MKNKMNYLCLSILAVLLLTGCRDNPNSTVDSTVGKDNPNSNTENITAQEVGIDLNGTYDQNDLLITTLEKEHGSITLEIPQIEGLKDIDVQEKINRDIYERVESAYKDIPHLEYVMYNTLANYSNVISIGVYIRGARLDSYTQIYLNYNLVNGNRLTFEELFLADTDTLEIIRSAFRERLIMEQMQGDYDENRLYKIVKSYNENPDKAFAFSPTDIVLYYKDYAATIKMIDIYDKVSIYSKYVTEDSLYERDDIGRKDLFTCMAIPEGAFDFWEFGLLEDNFWYDFASLQEYYGDETEEMHMEEYLDFKEDIYSQIRSQIEDYREIAKNNPERFYIILAHPAIYMESDFQRIGDEIEEYYTGNAVVNRNIQIFEMSRETYDKVYKDKLVDVYRYPYAAMAGGIMLEEPETETDVIQQKMSEEICYNYITGEQIVSE